MNSSVVLEMGRISVGGGNCYVNAFSNHPIFSNTDSQAGIDLFAGKNTFYIVNNAVGNAQKIFLRRFLQTVCAPPREYVTSNDILTTIYYT